MFCAARRWPRYTGVVDEGDGMTMVLWLAIGCGSDGLIKEPNVNGGNDTSFNEGDTSPPEIIFEALYGNQPGGEPVVMDATITDEGNGVFIATLYYRNETDSSKDWKSIGFVPGAAEGEYTATIPADAQHSSGMWYYLFASDGANETTSPEQGPDSPYHFGYTD